MHNLHRVLWSTETATPLALVPLGTVLCKKALERFGVKDRWAEKPEEAH
ncbi:hypothetical protein PS720_05738 [Pseudomonas fluorescens]|nr:hypothetical protein PS720_05738 [Pseudomonas fluorescens]